MSRDRLHDLLSLLDDPDENIAVSVMKELLKTPDSVLPLLGELQETGDQLLRKRIQQLEAIIALRDRRKKFSGTLTTDPLDIYQSLVDLHLLWFERTVPELLFEMLQIFMQEAGDRNLENLEAVGSFMAEKKFLLPPDEELLMPENYCIGAILDEHIGADIMLGALAVLVGIQNGLQLLLIQIEDGFAVCSRDRKIIMPSNNWQTQTLDGHRIIKIWSDPAEVIKHAALMIFLGAVCSDNLRYVHTIAHTLNGSDMSQGLDFLPFPYNGRKNS